jgi:AcrR family transcriptional regulator
MDDLESDAPLQGKAATQQRILAAAAKLFIERGFERTTISAVAEAAQVSRTTVFWHFSDKAGLFRESFSFLVKPFRESLERDLEDLPPEKRLVEQISRYQDMVSQHEETIRGCLAWIIESPDLRDWVAGSLLDLHQRVGGAISETLSEILPADEDPGGAAAALMSMLDGAAILSLYDPSQKANQQRQRGIASITALLSSKASSS